MPLAYDSFENTNHIGFRLHKICTCSTLHLVSAYTLHDPEALPQCRSDGVAILYSNRPNTHLRVIQPDPGQVRRLFWPCIRHDLPPIRHKSRYILWYLDYDILHGYWSLRSCLRIPFRSLSRVVPKTLSAFVKL